MKSHPGFQQGNFLHALAPCGLADPSSVLVLAHVIDHEGANRDKLLFLVQHLAAQWGYLRDPAGTTVWFHLPAADQSQRSPAPADPQAGVQTGHRPSRPDHARPTQLWAAAIQPTPA